MAAQAATWVGETPAFSHSDRHACRGSYFFLARGDFHSASAPLGSSPRACLDHPHRLAIDEQQVVHPTVRLLERKLPDRDAAPRAQVQRLLALYHLPGGGKLPVDLLAGPRLGSGVIGPPSP